MRDELLRADPRVVKAWVRGWTIARETAPPVRDGGGWRVDVGWPEQRTRYVFAALGDGIRRLGETIREPWVFLKACAPPDALRACLDPRWSVRPPGFFMTCEGWMTTGTAALGDGYTLDLAADRAVPVARIVDAAGATVCIGRLARVDGFAVYDRIETHPDHRRRGLARAVMKALETAARARGATRGLLVATADGRALYESLGWRLHSLYATAVIETPQA